MIHAILTLAFFFPFVWYGILFVIDYRKETGTTVFGRSIAAIKASWVVMWMQLLVGATGLLNLTGEIADAVTSDPNVGNTIQQLPAQYVAIGGLAIFLLTIVARLRSLGKPGVQ